MPDPVTEVVLAEADLDALVSPTSSDVWREMHGHSTEAVAAIAAKLAKEGGGGGSLPDWWTVDSTPGSEEVDFAGNVTITPQDDTAPHLVQIIAPAGYEANAPANGPILELSTLDHPAPIHMFDVNGVYENTIPVGFEGHEHQFRINQDGVGPLVQIGTGGITGASRLVLFKTDGSPWHKLGEEVGFFGAIPVVKQTGVAVNVAAIHAALVSYGLISA